jgi:hypothetical protein
MKDIFFFHESLYQGMLGAISWRENPSLIILTRGTKADISVAGLGTSNGRLMLSTFSALSLLAAPVVDLFKSSLAYHHMQCGTGPSSFPTYRVGV